MHVAAGLLRFLAAITIASVLAACGGGGSASSDAAPTAQTGPTQSVLVGAAATLDGSASADPEGAALAYRWALASRPDGSAAVLTGATTARPTFTADIAGTYVATLVVDDGGLASAPVSVTITALPTDTLTIAMDKPEPLTGTVNLSLSGPVAGAPVAWYVDLIQVGTGASVTWNASTVTNGTHLVIARIALAGAQAVEIRRTVNVSNPTVTLAASVSRTAGTIDVDIRASSPFGMLSVAASFDGLPLPTLDQPNACSAACGGRNDIYRFSIDAIGAGSGTHALLVTGTDRSGSSAEANIPVLVSNAPTLRVDSPADGTFVFGSLRLSGSSGTDKPGVVTVTARLGNVEILRTTSPAFSTDYDLTGVPPGSYALSLRAVDGDNAVTTLNRTVVVASAATLAPEPILVLGSNGRLLAAEGDTLLYAAEDQSVRLRDTATGAETTLQATDIAHATDWQVSGGKVYVFGQGNDCTVNFVCVYEWQVDGARVNLTQGNPWAGSTYQQHPVAHDGFVVWCNDGSAGSYTVYESRSGTYSQVVAPAGMNYVGNDEFDFAIVGGAVNLVFWGQTGGSGTSSTFDVYRWAADTGAATRLSAPGMQSVHPQTDGARVAWSQRTVGQSAGPLASLLVQPLLSGAPVAASSSMRSFMLRGGVLAWVEADSAGAALKASTAFATSTLSLMSSAVLIGVDSGRVVFAEDQRIQIWNAATGETRLRLDTWPGRTLVNGGRLYFIVGGAQALYKLDLAN